MTARPESLSPAQARRIALAAQGFVDPRHAAPTMRTFNRTLARTGVLQVDSVNVLQRAHYMPLFSRMGPYDTELLHRRRGEGAAAAGGVLGARAGVHAGRAVAGDAAPDGGVPAQAGQVVEGRVGRGDPRSSSPRSPTAARRPPASSSTPRRRSAAQGPLGLELVRGAQGPGLPLHGRRRRDRRPEQPVRGALRPAGAGHPRRGAGPADPDAWRRRTASSYAARPPRTGSRPCSASATTTGPRRRR